ncbi:FecR family protein [Chitinophaga vietnamensis]|uniref:FecR family protein n=1 Tax=Chitinophaga vietnamensis TaxID=2593957 RepID=UPI001177579D|nr:FecR domain-containing protein [Chitinophaga vietnamensis]
MSTKRTWELIGRKLAGEASAEELRELDQLLRAHPELHLPVDTMSDIWKQSADADRAAGEDAHRRHIHRMQQMGIDIGRMEDQEDATYLLEGSRRRHYRRYLVAAGISGAMLLAGWWAWKPGGKHRPAALSEVSTRNGSRTSIQLPDGSRVWLNAGSKLTYDKDFGSSSREVSLSGEAFFDVAKNAELPFIIHTAAMDVRVLGTRFNIRSYPGDKNTEAALIQGSIEASPKDRPAEKIILKPNEKILVLNAIPSGGSAASRQHSDPVVAVQRLTYYESADSTVAIETSWMDNKLVFRDESFASLAKRMERWYGVTIRFSEPQEEQLRFTGVFQGETVQQALNALKLIAAFNYTIKDNEITINQ